MGTLLSTVRGAVRRAFQERTPSSTEIGISISDEPSPRTASSGAVEAPRVSVLELHKRLGWRNALPKSAVTLTKSLADWRMEDDDAPIFRYLYREHQPRRHLEFGTWKGTGACYCLEECAATVWTINLLHGEDTADGNWAYGSAFPVDQQPAAWSERRQYTDHEVWYRTDSLGFIGKHYLEQNQGHRVCQIYCNTKDWDISNYPAGFFDSALIDGGHSEEIVTHDTRKACQLVRSGGLILWHDYCLDPDVLRQKMSPCGVVESISKNWEWLADQCQDIFWVYPSWILVGVKR